MRWPRVRSRPAIVLTVGSVLLLTACSPTGTGQPTIPPTSGGPATSTAAAPSSTISTPGGAGTSAAAPTTPLATPPATDDPAVTALATDDPAAAAAQSAAVASRSSAIAAATPAEFDTQTGAWFEAMCAGLADVDPADYDNDGNGSLSPIEETNYYRAMSRSFTATAQTATTLPPPTIDGGAELVTALSGSLATAGTDFGGLVAKGTGTADGPNQQIADILQNASETYIGIAYAPFIQSDPSVLKALHPLPSCAAVGW